MFIDAQISDKKIIWLDDQSDRLSEFYFGADFRRRVHPIQQANSFLYELEDFGIENVLGFIIDLYIPEDVSENEIDSELRGLRVIEGLQCSKYRNFPIAILSGHDLIVSLRKKLVRHLMKNGNVKFLSKSDPIEPESISDMKRRSVSYFVESCLVRESSYLNHISNIDMDVLGADKAFVHKVLKLSPSQRGEVESEEIMQAYRKIIGLFFDAIYRSVRVGKRNEVLHIGELEANSIVFRDDLARNHALNMFGDGDDHFRSVIYRMIINNCGLSSRRWAVSNVQGSILFYAQSN